MNCKIAKVISVFLVLLLALSLCMATGCGSQTKGEPTLPQWTEAFVETVVVPQIPEIDDGLLSLRQSMTGTSQLLAAAYFGFHGTEDAYAAIQGSAPELCEDLPFLQEIPQDRVIGEGGELFCIVPRDEDATVAVSKGYWDEENQQYIYDDLIYSGSTGEPILLFCNNAGWEPDTQVYISGQSGEVFWYPQTDDNLCVMAMEDQNGEELLLDFSDYRQVLKAMYRRMKEAEWAMPTTEMLIGESWIWDGFLKDGREVSYQLVFEEEILSVCWNDGMDEQDREYLYAPWELTSEGEFAVLTVDFGEFAGIVCYDLLYHQTFEQLYVAMDAQQESMPIGDEPLYRFLSQPTTPEPVAMVGLWELAWTEVEGDRVEAKPGECTVEIISAASGGLLMSYTSQQFPQNDFENELLTIDMRQMHIFCGNDEWVADVNYVGPWDTTYAITLTVDGILVKQNYFLLDGAPSVSYEYFRRVA